MYIDSMIFTITFMALGFSRYSLREAMLWDNISPLFTLNVLPVVVCFAMIGITTSLFLKVFWYHVMGVSITVYCTVPRCSSKIDCKCSGIVCHCDYLVSILRHAHLLFHGGLVDVCFDWRLDVGKSSVSWFGECSTLPRQTAYKPAPPIVEEPEDEAV